MRIGLVTDLHYCSLEELPGRRKPQLALRRLREALDRFARADARLIVCLGDLINDEGERNAENLDVISRVLKEPGLPCISLMGNHDCEAFSPEQFERITGWSAAPGTWQLEDVRLHFLNANYHWDGSAYQPGRVDWRQAHLPAEALSALVRALEDKGSRHFVFTHQCLDPFVESRHIIGNSAAIREALAAGNVEAVFQGHYHPGAHHVVDGIPYRTLPALCEWEESGAFLWDTEEAL